MTEIETLREMVGILETNTTRLYSCINMAMGCLDPDSKNPDERLAWFRLLDAINGDEPRAALASAERAGEKS